jgi:hypothetical protein
LSPCELKAVESRTELDTENSRTLENLTDSLETSNSIPEDIPAEKVEPVALLLEQLDLINLRHALQFLGNTPSNIPDSESPVQIWMRIPTMFSVITKHPEYPPFAYQLASSRSQHMLLWTFQQCSEEVKPVAAVALRSSFASRPTLAFVVDKQGSVKLFAWAASALNLANTCALLPHYMFGNRSNSPFLEASVFGTRASDPVTLYLPSERALLRVELHNAQIPGKIAYLINVSVDPDVQQAEVSAVGVERLEHRWTTSATAVGTGFDMIPFRSGDASWNVPGVRDHTFSANNVLASQEQY